ncbi:rhomboid family intramembrane serine protease [Metabacillus sp. RGM 3146]|uniref:rhomboid family intramembrane serine protease n=1 Tax=Metabacillus sp. RGM 3146 TaxID=3401092 RepID=UPI003B9C2A61
MAIEQDFLYWKLIDKLLETNKFRLVRLSEDENEVWFEPLHVREFQLIRIIRADIDWTNRLVRNIEATAGIFEEVRKRSGIRSMNVLNLWISEMSPVDDWEEQINRPFTFEKTAVKTIVAYEGNEKNALSELSSMLKLDVHQAADMSPHHLDYESLQQLKVKAIEKANAPIKEENNIFNYGKPFLTYLLIAIQVIMFIVLEISGGSTNNETLIRYGAKYNPLIQEGEWWRFITPIFLHIGIIHLLLNTLALYYVGMAVEKMYGSFRFLFIYLFAGIAGSLASFAFNSEISAGASGAIFGCFGALLYLVVIDKQLFFRTIGPNIIVMILLNLVIGFSMSNVDNSGHIGGLIGGFLATMVVQLPGYRKYFTRVTGVLAAVSLVIALFFYGSGQSMAETPEAALLRAQQLLNEENFSEARDLLEKTKKDPNAPAEVMFELSYAQIKLKDFKHAKENLQLVTKMKPDMDEALFNLSILYGHEGDFKNAKKLIDKAVQLKPDDQRYKEMKAQIDRVN